MNDYNRGTLNGVGMGGSFALVLVIVTGGSAAEWIATLFLCIVLLSWWIDLGKRSGKGGPK